MAARKQLFNLSTLQLFNLSALLAAALMAGCATRMQPNRQVHVYVAENTAITFDGETFMQVDQLPKRLLKAGATPENVIILIPQGNVPDIYLKSIIASCGRNGLPNIIVKEQLAPSSYTQKSGTGIPVQAGATPPRMIPPGAKSKAQKGMAKRDDRDLPAWKRKK